jgi:transcriptional regulator with XRE-family HTH domain
MARRDIYAARHILARNLRRLRRAQEMTQEQLANAAGLRQALISELESSKLDVRIDTLNRVALALDASMAELFDETKRA